ncbi:MAG: biopolymer transporter ExbD [Deltaproteobacteria bacterium]|jgi:biopolymer transport protein ExbD|nr:biopolymer transporter ExbD [Deltaproteobacteria bacterium]MBW2534226.1 biopolymer transporter ExbD [Deltaproteobacteria bacterium]
MGGISLDSGGGGKRPVNAELALIPFIDFLLVTVAFLLITAVWVTFSRMNANAQIPGPPNPDKEITPATPEKILHVHIGDAAFSLVWKQGATVVSETKVIKPDQKGEFIKYADLAKKISEEWKTHGGHQDPADKKVDQAVLHADNRLPFKEVVAVMDAIYETQREFKVGGGSVETLPSFNMTFSVR